VLGVPADFDALANSGVLSRAGLTRVRSEPAEPGDPVVDDVAAGELIGSRLGREVVERLVDPLLGGVYAGRADQLSLRATMPALAEKLTTERSLVRAARSLRAAAAGESGPVFATVQGGLSRLVSTVAYRSQAAVRTGLPARDLQPTDDGWRVIVGSTRDRSVIGADAVVLATPAAPAARLLGGVSPAAAAEIGAIDYASIALVTFVLRGTIALPPGSGALIPAAPDRLVKAVTYISQKWAEATPPGFTVLRASVGRYGEERALQLDDDELVAAVQREIAVLLGRAGRELPTPVATRVNRWGGALPQYAVGHLDRVARARAALADHPTLALAGAAYDGVGIPACIRSGQAAADQVLAALQRAPVLGHV
jgi:oxygen-dependent protoporphyrinogen oxidase